MGNQLQMVRLLALLAVLGVTVTLFQEPRSPAEAATGQIQHVVVIYQENHSFNEILGWICLKEKRCKGTDTGLLRNGDVIELQRGPDIVPGLKHTIAAQRISINNGQMNGFSKIHGCTAARHYACYQRYRAFQIPNLAALARTFTISDHTFETDVVSSWGSHIEIVAAQLDGFTGDNPEPTKEHPDGPGWGCDSYRDAPWKATASSKIVWVPSCIPQADGSGPYRASPVKYVPTIMDRLDEAGLSWRIYRPGNDPEGPRLPYGWAICPTFAECLYGPQAADAVEDTQVIADAQSGQLPTFSIVIPQGRNSQHNGWSMRMGDNWIGDVVEAIEKGPNWSSTAIFITYDDCGCFYDQMPPPAGLGVRVPMVIVSPFARPAFTDTSIATYSSILAFLEHTFGLTPLTGDDANAYDYSGAFDYTQTPIAGVEMGRHPLPRWEVAYLRKHPPPPDET
ncbi:MAG: alkaline phosphatase family protein [Actinomycetota bacterium]